MTNCVDSCGIGNWSGPLPGDPDNNSILSAVSAFGGIDLSWTYPAVNPHAVAHINVLRGVTPVFGGAAQRAVATGNYHFDVAEPGITYFYWIQIVSSNGTVGAAIGPASAIAKSTIEKTIADLTGVIDSSMLAQSLNTQLGHISDLTSGLSGEIGDRTAANTALSLSLNTLNTDLAQTLSYVQNEISVRSDQNALLLNVVNSNATAVNASISALNAQIADVTGSPIYNNATAYAVDQIVKYNGSLYKSTAATTGNLPTDTNYWVKIGDYASIGDAVAGHAIILSDQDTRITNTESGLTSEVSNRQLLATKMTGMADPSTGTLGSLSSGLLFDERTARSSADATEVSARQTLSTTVVGSIDATGKTLGNITSGILFDEKTARSTADATEVSARQLLSTTVIGAADPTGKTLANITSGILYDERTARSTADSTEVSARQLISTKVLGVADPTSATLANISTGILFDEKNARSTADASEVSARQTLSTALIGANDPTGKTLANLSTGMLFDEKTARSNADATEVSARQLISTKLIGIADPTSSTLANITSGILFDEKTARSTADATEVSARQLISTSLLGHVDPTGKTLANLTSGIIFDEKTSRSTETTALASRASTLEAAVNNDTTGLGTKASVTYVDTAKADAISASAATINLLEAKVTKTRKWENTALVNGNPGALIEAILKNIDNTTILDSGAVFGGYGPVSYRVDARTTGTATVTGATSIFTSTWNGSVWVWSQRIINELGASSNHPRLYLSGGVPTVRLYDHTSSYPITYTVSANVSAYSPEAAVLIEQTARVDADSTLAGQITTVQSSAAGNLATVQTNLSTSINTVDGKVMSMYTAKVNVNGLIGGFGIYNNGASVDAGFDVDTFWVGRTTNKIRPFIVTGSTVYINEAVIGKLTANAIDTRGLSIKDAAGSVILQAGTGLGFNARFGGNTTNLPADNATSGKSLCKPLNQWSLSSQVIATVSDGKIGSEVLRITGSLGYPNAGVFYPIDRTKTYRTRFWARPSADNASGVLYFCLQQFTAANPVMTAGVNGGRAPYKPSGISRTWHISAYGDTWGEYSYTWTAADWQSDMKYVRPDFLDNYPGAAGYWEIQDFTFEEVTEAVTARTVADQALSDATTKAEAARVAAINAAASAADAKVAAAKVISDAYADGVVSIEEQRAINDATAKANAAQAAAVAAAALDATAKANLAATTSTWSGVSGTDKPADNATVGANASNFTGTIGGDNLTYNSSFESNNGLIGTGWSIYNNAGESEPTTAQIVAGRTGGSAQQISWTVAHWNTKGIYGVLCNGEWTPLKTYVVSFWARTTNLSSTSNCFITWNISPASATTLSSPNLTTEWQRYAFRITMGATVEPLGRCHISVSYGAGAGNVQFDDLMVVEGDVLPSYYPSAKEAQDKAITAQTTATNAATSASAATAELSKIADDAYLSRGEKPEVVRRWLEISGEITGIVNQAWSYGLYTADYQTSHDALNTFLSGISPAYNNYDTDSVIDRAAFNLAFNNYYAQRQYVVNDIAAAAKVLANTAQTTAVSAAGVTLINDNGMTIVGNTVTKTGGNNGSWDGAFRSQDSFTGGASVSFVPVATNSWLMIGLGTNPTANFSYATIDYAFYCVGNGELYMQKFGVQVGGAFGYAVGDVLSITYDGVNIRFMKNGAVLSGGTIPAVITAPIFVDSSFHTTGASVKNIQFSAMTTASAAASFLTSSNMVQQGNTFAKTSANGWDASFRSKDAFTGGAVITFIPSQLNCYLAVGLNTDAGADNNITSIDYALECVPGGAIYWQENAVTGQQIGTYAIGDVLGVSYDGVNIRYLKNGVALRTVPVVITAPLFADSSFYSPNATVSNVQFGAMTSLNDPSVKNPQTWVNVVNTTVVGNTITSLVTGWGSSNAQSIKPLGTGTAYVRATVSIGQDHMIGLSLNPTADNNYYSINYAAYANSGTFSVYNGSSNLGNFGTCVVGDTIEVIYNGITVKYYVNGAERHSQTAAASLVFYAKVAFSTVGLQFTNVQSGSSVNFADSAVNNSYSLSKSANSILAATIRMDGSLTTFVGAGITAGNIGGSPGAITGTGVAVLSGGIFGTKAGVTTFAIDASTGDATFAGKLKASTVEGSVNVTTTGNIRGGKTASNFGAEEGFFLGYDGGAYRFSVGKSGGVGILWDGSNLTIKQAPFSLDPSTMPDIYGDPPNGTFNWGTFTATVQSGGGGVAPYTYVWSKGGGGTSGIYLSATNTASITISTNAINGVVDGWVKCTVTDSGARVTSYTLTIEAIHGAG